ncbi:MAG TPA: hypothetical protein VEV41_03840 [Terriglobales bacterium]|jgi:hypothetical protein|nr:hypothetical protein [Terriglobales bacterium]
MKKIFATAVLLALMATAALAGGSKGSWTGYVSDAKCGAKVNAECAKKCADAGQPLVFVNDADKSVLPVANQEALKDHAGHHVKVEGSLDNNTLTVDNVSMVADEGAK